MTNKRNKNPGWPNEPVRHGLSAMGIKSATDFIEETTNIDYEIDSKREFDDREVMISFKDGQNVIAIDSIETIIKMTDESMDEYGYIIQLSEGFNKTRSQDEWDSYITFLPEANILTITDSKIDLSGAGKERLKESLEYALDDDNSADDIRRKSVEVETEENVDWSRF